MFPLNVPVKDLQVLSFDDSKYISKTLLDKLEKEKMKIKSTVITLEVEKQQTAAKAKAKAVATKSSASAKVVLLSGFRDANL
jgi:hypothetical protein